MQNSPLDPRSKDGFNLSGYYKDHYAPLTRAELEFMSRADGLTSSGGMHVYIPTENVIELSVGGSLTKVALRRDGTGETKEDVGGIRGAVITFSAASRRRLMRLIASTKRDNRPIFATLTYPDIFINDAKRWKRDIDAFGKRFRRLFPNASFVWRIEFKTRKTGANKGMLAPHFHLLVWDVGMIEFRAFVGPAWYAVVGSGNEDHRMASTKSERIRTFNGLMRYVSKYIAKLDEYPSVWAGRAWGAVNRIALPIAPILAFALNDMVATKLVRLGRKMIKAKGKTLVYGLTWIVDTERIMDYIEIIGFA